MTVADKILFTCSACQYRARIPGHYAGRSIHCPGCKTIQAVSAIEEAGVPRSAPVAKLDTPAVGHAVLTTGSTAPGANKIVFACSSCSYKGRLGAEYDGKTIRCPGCQTAQVVKGTPAPAPIVASMAADETAFRGGDTEKIRFACSACGYRARIPGKYADKPIHCPQCKQIQVAKAETDLEEATGRTVSISRVTPAAVSEPRMAMTNVGVQFHCAVCGFESRISPSCAGDAIYCPSCRAPQKMEWGDPAATAAPTSAIPKATATESAPAEFDLDLPLSTFEMAVPAAASPGAQKPEIEVTDLFAVLPEAPIPPTPAAPVVTKKGGRRIVSVGGATQPPDATPSKPASPLPSAPRAATPVAPPAPAPIPVPAAAPSATDPATASSVARPRRSVPTPGKPGGSVTASSAETVAPTPRAPASAPVPRAEPVAPAKASKLPLIVLAMLVLGLIAISVVLFLQIGDLKTQQVAMQQAAESARVKAAADASAARDLLAEQKAAAEKSRLAAEAAQREVEAAQREVEAAQHEVEAAKLAAESARAELEALKAAAPVVPAPPAAPAPSAPKKP